MYLNKLIKSHFRAWFLVWSTRLSGLLVRRILNFTNASSVFPILCRNQGCKGCMCPPSFWQTSWPYINQESRLCPAHYYVPPRIFRPSDGPASGRHDGTQDLYAHLVCSYVPQPDCTVTDLALCRPSNLTKLKSELSNIQSYEIKSPP